MSEMLSRFEPDASELLKLAVRAQHLGRWRIPRQSYPAGRAGYLKWRRAAAELHASLCAELLSASGYDATEIARVQSLVRKRELRSDIEAQTLEDVACLVFLEHYFDAFAQEHDEEKIANILRKTWKKMSERGQQAALQLSFGASAKARIESALADTTT